MNIEDSAIYSLQRGTVPVLLSIPHLGTSLPEDLRGGFSDEAFRLADTDWHLDRLYGFAAAMGIGILCAKVSRYVIDLNRPPNGESLYPGQTTTGLCPTSTFRGAALYRPGHEPDAAEIDRRLTTYWQPYHAALRSELSRLRTRHGRVLLWEGHSIASVLPRLFAGKLPDLNFGTNGGAACDDALLQATLAPLGRGSGCSHVVNDRFKGGYITRRYGEPARGVHAIQLEMCQSLYMNENDPFDYLEDKAARIQPVLEQLMAAAAAHLA